MRKSVKGILTLKENDLRLPQFDMFLEQLRENFGTQDQEFQMSVSKYVREESDEQRGYFFGVVVPSAVECYKKRGYIFNKDQMYLKLKMMFFYELLDSPDGVEPMPRSMAKGKATLQEVKELIDQVVMYLYHEFGYQVPPPRNNDRKSLR